MGYYIFVGTLRPPLGRELLEPLNISPHLGRASLDPFGVAPYTIKGRPNLVYMRYRRLQPLLTKWATHGVMLFIRKQANAF